MPTSYLLPLFPIPYLTNYKDVYARQLQIMWLSTEHG